MTDSHAITLYVPDHATKDQVEHIQQTLQIAVDRLPDRAFIIVDVPKHVPARRVIEMKHEMQRIIEDGEDADSLERALDKTDEFVDLVRENSGLDDD